MTKKVSRNKELAHIERLQRKRERLQMLRAFIIEWEDQEQKDPEYLKELYRKTDRLQNQISVMAL